MKLGNKEIVKEGKEFFFIAEIGTNYVEIAKEKKKCFVSVAEDMVLKAALSGANAVKFQVYDPEYLANETEAGGQLEYLKAHAVLSFKDYEQIIGLCQVFKIEFMATLFTDEAINALGPKLNVLKVASPDITDMLLLNKIGAFKKPVLLSTAGSTIAEINQAISWIGHNDIALLHCTGNYPVEIKNINFGMIKFLNKYYPLPIGYSDHILPETMFYSPTYAFLMGANIIEKHFTLDRSLKGNDHIHSFTPDILKVNIDELNKAKIFIGNYHKGPTESEADFILGARRSLAIKRTIGEGETIGREDIITLRPATGIPPIDVDKVVGCKAKKTIDRNSILYYGMLHEKT